MITEGIAAFVNLDQTESFNGQDTGKFSIVVTMDELNKDVLEKAGVKVREYKNQPQRKFVTKFPDFKVVDTEDNVVSKSIPYGSKVRVQWSGGEPHPVHGVSPYFKAIRVLEYADSGGDGEDAMDDPDF
tara:strand:- start:800 stop:1186 length:387 start_codon:yes stop_codon:yes gene_type:complete